MCFSTTLNIYHSKALRYSHIFSHLYIYISDVIALKNIVKRFGKKIAINNFSLAVSQGECLCLLGREKSGKSTLLNIVTGHTFPSSGTMLIYSREIILSTIKVIKIECVN